MTVFIRIVFGVALTICVLAVAWGVGDTGAILYRIGAVIAILSGIAALTGSLINDLLNGYTHVEPRRTRD